MMNRDEAMEYVVDELDHIKEKWGRADGDWPADPFQKMCILTEEVGEIAMGVNDRDWANVKQELAQVAAVCLSWLMADFHSKEAMAANVQPPTKWVQVQG